MGSFECIDFSHKLCFLGPRKLIVQKVNICYDKENKSGIEEEDFFDFITRFQSKRMDDQRCSLTVPGPMLS